MYPETTQGAYFAYDEKGMMLDKTCFMFSSPFAKYLQRILSSRLFEYAYKHIYSSVALGVHGYQYNKHALVKLPIVIPSEQWQTSIEEVEVARIDDMIYSYYSISPAEIEYIEAINYSEDSM